MEVEITKTGVIVGRNRPGKGEKLKVSASIASKLISDGEAKEVKPKKKK